MPVDALDIETVKDESVDHLFPPVDAPETEAKVLKKDTPETIAQKRCEAKKAHGQKVADAVKARDKKMCLSPFYGRIATFAMYGDTRNFYEVLDDLSDKAEAELVRKILENLKVGGEKVNHIVTWNGFEFDIPYIYKRAAILRVPLPDRCPVMGFWAIRYKNIPHCDLMKELSGWSYQGGMKLDDVAQRILGAGKTERDYSTYLDLIKNGQIDEIGKDNMCDAKLTYELFNHFSSYFFR